VLGELPSLLDQGHRRPVTDSGCELARLGSAEQMASAGYTRRFDKRSWLKKVAQPFWRQPSRRTY
jgi:hypothetical protein